MALESCKPGDKKNSLLANYQQSFRIDDLLRQKAIEQQPDHFSLPPPYTKLKLGKKFWIHASNIVCGVREGVGPV